MSLFELWRAMWQRCYNPKAKGFQNYGGRGVAMCADWQHYPNFVRDMAPRPPGTTLDRIDNLLGYSQANCRWRTPKEQQRNRRNNRRITFRGETHAMSEWAEILGIPYPTLQQRIRLKWPLERALNAQKRHRYGPIIGT
jgi:hypothetical protein